MTTARTMYDYGGTSLSSRCDTLLLGRLGTELALIYHDTLQSPLPPRLQAIIDRLDAASRAHREREADE